MNYGGTRASSQLAIESHIIIANKEARQIVEITILAQAEQKKEESNRPKFVSPERSVLPVWQAEQISYFRSAG
jgi:hypothetical protein